MLGPVSNQHRMTAIKQQVVLIIYSNPTPLALALCVSDAVLGIALNWGSSQAHCGNGFLLSKRYVSTDVCWGHQQPTVISTVHEVAVGAALAVRALTICGVGIKLPVARKKERKKWRTSLSPKAMGPRAAAGGKCAV
jgi:hypothetical protein